MLDDFTPIIHNLPGRTIKVWPVADVHIGAREADIDGFASFLSKIAQDEDSYLVICGDLVNNGIKDSLTNVYEEIMPPHAQIEKAVELLTPVADKILGCVSGNHENRTRRSVGVDVMAQIMTLLGKPELYRQNMAFMRITLRNKGVSTHDHYAILLVHGKTANKQKWFSYSVDGIDAVVGGHLHQGSVAKNSKLVFTTSNNVIVKPFINMTAASWLKFGGYAARDLMMPSAVSDPQCLVLEFTGTNRKRGTIRVSW